ncbi:MAG: hypothetical protein P8L37_06285 [Phycisphaerales bacterium]|nr:hypothetical protein [Phycisphaerales bacterium]
MNAARSQTTPMNRRTRTLLLLNVALLIAVGLVGFSTDVQAQLGLRSHYLMVAGAGESEKTDRIWMLDTREIGLAAMQWDDSSQSLKTSSTRSVKNDIDTILKSR